MSETIDFETIHAAKKAHAEAVIAALENVQAIIASEPELWFGGLPPSLIQLDHLMTHKANELRAIFEIAED